MSKQLSFVSTIGTDPEFFLKRKSDGKLVSAIPFIEGTKEEPKILKSGGNLQRDNVAVEFATAPAKTKDDFITSIRNTMMEVVSNLPDGHEIVAIPSADFDPSELDDPEAQRFGCVPDCCAWKAQMNEPPTGPRPTFRSCGGHVHVGFVKGSGNDFLVTFEGKLITVRTMDLFHGVISVILDNSKESIERRELYGKAGCHRPTDYGIEYRTLSNYWIKTPLNVALIWSLKEDVLKLVRENKATSLIDQVGAQNIQDTINFGKVDTAVKITETYLLPNMSEESSNLFNLCLENTNNTTSLMESWNIGG